MDEIGKYKLALVANGEKGLGVLDMTSFNAIKLLDDWDNPMDKGSANRVRLFANTCEEKEDASKRHPLFRKKHQSCSRSLGFLADGLTGLKIFELKMK